MFVKIRYKKEIIQSIHRNKICLKFLCLLYPPLFVVESNVCEIDKNLQYTPKIPFLFFQK